MMKIPNKVVVSMWHDSNQDIHAFAQRAAEWALSQHVSMEPVSMEPYCYEVVKAMCDDMEFSRTKVKDAILNEPLYTATQLAAARQQGAEEERKKWSKYLLDNFGLEIE